MVSTFRASFNIEREKLKIENQERKTENSIRHDRRYEGRVDAPCGADIASNREHLSDCIPSSIIAGVAAGGGILPSQMLT